MAISQSDAAAVVVDDLVQRSVGVGAEVEVDRSAGEVVAVERRRHFNGAAIPDGFFAGLRNDGEFCAAPLKIEDGVGWISLGKEDLLRLQLDDLASQPGIRQKGGDIKISSCWLNHLDDPFRRWSFPEVVQSGMRWQF